jgi:hypothetical protein
MHRIFILSPAKTNGKRASILMSDRAEFDLAKRLRTSDGVPLGEVFSFLSGLYFRGKYAYSQHFARPPKGHNVNYVITSDRGLMNPAHSADRSLLRTFADVPIELSEPRYSEPLRAGVVELERSLPRDCEVVLLGSIATNKYSEILVERFGARLMFPHEFIGRGDMSRGGLMLRAVKANKELEYVSLTTVESRRGPRPPKLPNQKESADAH